MRAFTCDCGIEIAESDTDTLVGPVHEHFSETHPEYRLTPVAIRNYLEAEDRATGSTERRERIGEASIAPIEPSRADEIIDFFDHDLFADNPAWGSCYCMFWFLGGGDNPDWGNQPWQEYRSAQHDRLTAGRTTGTLAYVDGRLAGWCNATARSELPAHRRGDDESVCSVVCLAVAPPYRRHGIARELLRGAVAMARERGFTAVEGYPVRDAADHLAAFRGTIDLFAGEGFEVVSDDPLVMRLELA